MAITQHPLTAHEEDELGFTVESEDDINQIVQQYNAVGNEFDGSCDETRTPDTFIFSVKTPDGKYLLFYAHSAEMSRTIWENLF
jgi:hypothetical protein